MTKKVQNSVVQKGIDMYFEFFKIQTQGRKPKFGAVDHIKLSAILQHFENEGKDPLDELEKIFAGWDRLEPWLRNQALDLCILEKKLNMIIVMTSRKRRTRIDRSKVL